MDGQVGPAAYPWHPHQDASGPASSDPWGVEDGSAYDGDPTWMDATLSSDERAHLLAAQLTLGEKVRLSSGSGGFQRYDRPGVRRLGIPPLDNIDSGLGVRNIEGRNATSLPSGPALASSWDPEVVRAAGRVVGAEAYALGHNELLGPSLDISRTPNWGRIFENFGEDPLLSGVLGAANVAGIQESPIIAQAKHFVSNTQEHDRASVNERVSDRALREIFTRPFEAAVDVGLGSVMSSFNKINGIWASENRHVLTDILKRDFGFLGYVQTDFDANHTTVESALAGLDIEGPGIKCYGPSLEAAVLDGRVPLARLNDMVHRILRTYFERGLFDHPAPRIWEDPVERPFLSAERLAESDQVACDAAKQGIVLLKNDGLLPLCSSASVVVIGADADFNIQGAGSSGVFYPPSITTVLRGIVDRADGAVRWIAGTDPVTNHDQLAGPPAIPSCVLRPVDGGPDDRGVRGEYFFGDISGDPHYVRTQLQPQANLNLLDTILGPEAQLPHFPVELSTSGSWRPIVVRYTAILTPPGTGEYVLSLTHWGSARLVVDGVELIPRTRGGAWNTVTTATVFLTADVPVPVLVEFWGDADYVQYGGPQIRLGWMPPEGVLAPDMRAAVDAAARHDVAVIVVRDFNGEAGDRAQLTLPQDQNRLVDAVVAANPNTVVVSATGGPALMPWIDRVPAVLQSWYGGQRQGSAVAAALFGDINPSGKLPLSFPRGEHDHPLGSPPQFPGIGGAADHLEDIFVGYRGYERAGLVPLFPFGHGLSYTTFSYGELRLLSDPSAHVVAAFTITNTGDVAGAEIAQIYVGHLPTDMVETAPKQLAAFSKVWLQPGESTQVEVPLDAKTCSYWDAYANRWVTPSGPLQVMVGASSVDIRLAGQVMLQTMDVEGLSALSPDTAYTIENAASNCSLDVVDPSRIEQRLCLAPQASTLWRLEPVDDGTYQIVNVGTGCAVQANEASTSPGQQLSLASVIPEVPDHQRFRLDRVGGGQYRLVSKSSGLCIDIDDVSRDGAAAILTHARVAAGQSDGQAFMLRPFVPLNT